MFSKLRDVITATHDASLHPTPVLNTPVELLCLRLGSHGDNQRNDPAFALSVTSSSTQAQRQRRVLLLMRLPVSVPSASRALLCQCIHPLTLACTSREVSVCSPPPSPSPSSPLNTHTDIPLLMLRVLAANDIHVPLPAHALFSATQNVSQNSASDMRNPSPSASPLF